jgi:hypothetical protein
VDHLPSYTGGKASRARVPENQKDDCTTLDLDSLAD